MMPLDIDFRLPIRLLHVDDEIGGLTLVRIMLTTQGVDCVSSSNVDEALEILKSQTFDFIISDLMMPGMNGFEFIQILKTNHETADIPVIFLTSMGNIDTVRTGMELGAVDYLRTPILHHNIGEVVARHSLRIMLQQHCGVETIEQVEPATRQQIIQDDTKPIFLRLRLMEHDKTDILDVLTLADSHDVMARRTFVKHVQAIGVYTLENAFQDWLEDMFYREDDFIVLAYLVRLLPNRPHLKQHLRDFALEYKQQYGLSFDSTMWLRLIAGVMI